MTPPKGNVPFDLRSVGGRPLLFGKGREVVWDFGWRPPGNRTLAEEAFAAGQETSLKDFKIRGRWQMEHSRYALWKFGRDVLGQFLPYNWQLSGSCVGAGGGNMQKTLMATEIALGELEEYVEVCWLYTYGRSRQRSGTYGSGEGSTGAGFAAAATQDGFIAEGAEPSLPKARRVLGWLQYDRPDEIQWSDGARANSMVVAMARRHLIKTVARGRGVGDVVAALVNGHGVTQASLFGTRNLTPKPRGTPPVRLATWDATWAHQTWLDEVWDHPDHGVIFRYGNNWGPKAHGAPTGDEPPGGLYVDEQTVDRMCKTGEVFIYSAFNGFPARKVTTHR